MSRKPARGRPCPIVPTFRHRIRDLADLGRNRDGLSGSAGVHAYFLLLVPCSGRRSDFLSNWSACRCSLSVFVRLFPMPIISHTVGTIPSHVDFTIPRRIPQRRTDWATDAQTSRMNYPIGMDHLEVLLENRASPSGDCSDSRIEQAVSTSRQESRGGASRSRSEARTATSNPARTRPTRYPWQ